MTKKPISAAASARVLLETPRHATTIAGEMTAHILSLIEQEMLSHVKLRAAPQPAPPVPNAPKHLINVSAGTGKTRAAIAGVIRAVTLGMRVVVAVPTTSLGLDIHSDIEKSMPGISGVWLGREKQDPNNPEQRMCPRHEAARAAHAIGLRPSAACGSKAQDFCQHYPKRGRASPCAYRLQNLKDKQVVIIAGDKMLELAPGEKMKRGAGQKTHARVEEGFQLEMEGLEQQNEEVPLKKAISDSDFDILFVDETSPFAFVKGFEDSRPFVPAEHFNARLCKKKDDQEILSAFLWDLHEKLIEATGRHMPQYFCEERDNPYPMLLALDVLECVHEVAQEALDEIAQEASESKELVKSSGKKILDAAANLIARRGLLLKIQWICEALTLGHKKGIEPLAHLAIERHGDTVGLHIRRKVELFRRYSLLPTLFLDATGEGQLLELSFGPIDQSYNRKAVDGTGVKRYQLRDEVLPYSKLDNPIWPLRIRLFAELLEIAHGTVGLVVPMKVERQIEESINASVKIMHFGEERGNNSLEEVAVLIVASRQAKHPSHLEDMVTVLTEESVQRLPDGQRWYPNKEGFIIHRSQETGWLIPRDYHPDPLVECARRSITEAGLEQSLARSRNVRRNEGKPLHEYVLTNAPTSRLVDGTFTKAEFLAVASWLGELLMAGIWVADGKGQGVLQPILRGICSQRRECLLEYIIGNPAFETPELASNWRKDQLADNPEIARLVNQIDRKLSSGKAYVNILFAPFPLKAFQPIRTKVRGARYFAQVYVRVNDNERPEEALRRILGDEMGYIEVKPK